MTLRHKKPRPLTRKEKPFRDSRLFVVATEDTHAPDRYFGIFDNPRIKVLVLPTEEGMSAPAHVLERLDAYESEYDLREDDERWLMLDTDHWAQPNHVPNYKEVCSQALNRGFNLANSNPSFEVWLLLHVRELATEDQFRNCAEVERELKRLLGAYSKRTFDLGAFSPETARLAVARAKKLDAASNDRWPQKTGTHVYKVVEKLL